MGLLTGLLQREAVREPARLDASLQPFNFPPGPMGFAPFGAEATTVVRSEALQVPAVSRARNLLAGTIGEFELHRYDTTGQRLDALPWQRQPDAAATRAVTIAYTVDDLFFGGWAWWQITEIYREDGRPARFRRLDPARVSYDSTPDGQVVRWLVDLKPVPAGGLGSLIAFQGLDEGLLSRAGRTIRTALELERAAQNYAKTPLPAAVLKNTGADLPGDKVSELLARWREARRDGAVGYLNANIELERIGFDPAALQLTEARSYVVQELARACNIPAFFLGAEATTMTYSNVTAERRSLIDYSMRPFISAIEQRLSMDDVVPITQVVRFGLDEYLRGDVRERMEVYRTLRELDVLSIDEIRAMEDLSPRGDADA
jgi:HK97 family phage portal protein